MGGNGIWINDGAARVTIRNGTILGTTNISVDNLGETPLTWAPSNVGGFKIGAGTRSGSTGILGVRFENLTCSKCAEYGFYSGHDSVFENCVASENMSAGIVSVNATLNRCTLSLNGPLGGFYSPFFPSVVTNCKFSFNAGAAIGGFGNTIIGCQASFNHGGIASGKSTIKDCVSYGNNLGGIQGDGGSISGCTATSNGEYGIKAENGAVTNCSVSNNTGDGISAAYGTVTGCQASENRIGINAYGGTINQCRATNNRQHGIYGTAGVISFCAASGNNTSATAPFTDIFPAVPAASRTGNFPTP